MRQSLRITLVAVMLAGWSGLLRAAPKEEAAQRELAKLAGTWQLLSVEVNGKGLLSADEAKKRSAVIKGGRLTLSGEENKEFEAALKIDASKEPRQLDIQFTSGPAKGNVLRGVYKLEGDKLTICHANGDADLPTDFTSKPGDGKAVLVYRRVKP